jgi:hypothetical protein
MPNKYTNFPKEEFIFFKTFAEKLKRGELEFSEEEFSRIAVGMEMMVENLKEYQTQRLKINKESRESKKAARDGYITLFLFVVMWWWWRWFFHIVL